MDHEITIKADTEIERVIVLAALKGLGFNLSKVAKDNIPEFVKRYQHNYPNIAVNRFKKEINLTNTGFDAYPFDCLKGIVENLIKE